jgi:hypothetical protein
MAFSCFELVTSSFLTSQFFPGAFVQVNFLHHTVVYFSVEHINKLQCTTTSWAVELTNQAEGPLWLPHRTLIIYQWSVWYLHLNQSPLIFLDGHGIRRCKDLFLTNAQQFNRTPYIDAMFMSEKKMCCWRVKLLLAYRQCYYSIILSIMTKLCVWPWRSPTASWHYEFLQTALSPFFLVNKNISVVFKGSKDSTIYLVEGNVRAHVYVVVHSGFSWPWPSIHYTVMISSAKLLPNDSYASVRLWWSFTWSNNGINYSGS